MKVLCYKCKESFNNLEEIYTTLGPIGVKGKNVIFPYYHLDCIDEEKLDFFRKLSEFEIMKLEKELDEQEDD